MVEDYLSVERQGDIKQGLKDLYLDCEKDLGDISGISFGFSSLDQLTGGFQESDLIVIGARPSGGKNSLCPEHCFTDSQTGCFHHFFLRNGPKELLVK